MRRITWLLAGCLLGSTLCQAPAVAWSINTHMYSANLVIKDLQDDGQLDIQKVVRNPDGTVSFEPLTTVAIDAAVADAILAFPEVFRAGSCGPDGYPDVYIGQSIIHPYIPGQPWRATDWARRVLQEARGYRSGEDRQKALAFAAGWVVHYAGDAFGHTWVNGYAGGEWDWGDMGIVTRHVVLEGYVNSKLPHDGDGTDDMSLDMQSGFMVDATLLSEDTYGPLASAGHMRALVDYHTAFRAMERKCEKRQDQWWNPVSWAIGAVEDWLEHYRKESERAMSEWVETSTVVMRCMADGNIQDIPGEYTEWAIEYPFRLCPAIPKQIVDVMAWLGHEISWLMSPVSKLQDEVVAYVYDALLADTVEALTNAEALMGEVYSAEERARADEDMGVENGQGPLVPDKFEALRDTVALGKLALLDNAGLNQVGEALGVGDLARENRDNILWDCINSLDASNQLSRYPPVRILETEELKQQAFERLFVSAPGAEAPSRIDPTHVAAYLTTTDKEVAFVIPVADPGNDRCRVIASIYQKPQGAGPDQRVPFYAGGIPSTGTAGLYAPTHTAKYKAPRYGRYRFHLCTAEQKVGSEELVEDRGIDIEVDVVTREEFYGTDLPFGEVHGADGDAWQEAIEMLEQALADPLVPAETRAYLQAQLDAMRGQGTGAAAPAVEDDEIGAFPPEMVAVLRRTAAGGGDAEDEAAQTMQQAVVNGKFAVGSIEGPEGPVAGAMLTLLHQPIHQQLVGTTGTALVQWADWFPAGAWQGDASSIRYGFSRSNALGQYVFYGVEDGLYELIASAPGLGRTRQTLAIQRGQTPIADMPRITLTREPAGAAGGDDEAERTWPPDIVMDVQPRFINADVMAKDRTFRATVSLRPLAGFSGPVTLSVLDLPPDVETVFSENPVLLDGPQMVTLTLKAGHEVPPGMVVLIRAEGGQVVKEVPAFVSLGTGQLATKPEVLRIAAGGRSELRLMWQAPEGRGQAAMLSVGKLPPGVWIKAKALRAHEHAQPLVFEGLTVQRAEELREGLRPIAAVPAVPRPQRPILTTERIIRGPAEAPFGGIFLAPGGWADLTIAIATDVRPGAYKIPVECRIGEQVFEESVQVVVEP